jgi:hypothetical protein
MERSACKLNSVCHFASPSRLLQYFILRLYSILFYSILFYSILFYSILFYSILFYSKAKARHVSGEFGEQQGLPLAHRPLGAETLARPPKEVTSHE